MKQTHTSNRSTSPMWQNGSQKKSFVFLGFRWFTFDDFFEKMFHSRWWNLMEKKSVLKWRISV